MRKEYVSLRPEDTVLRAAEVMAELGSLALPVVDGDGRLASVLTAMDIIGLALPSYLEDIEDLSFLPGSLELPSTSLPDPATLTVAELCAVRAAQREAGMCPSQGHQVVNEDESLLEVARVFAREGALKCPVVRDGRLVGMIEPHDLLRTIFHRPAEGASPS